MINKKKILLIFAVTIFFLYFLLLFMVDVLNEVNVHGHILLCQNKLKMIAKAINLYQTEWNDQWPSSLIELEPYYEGEYKPGPNTVPQCPGNRNEKEESSPSNYYYFKPNVAGIVPVCWDSDPHYNTRPNLAPATKKWNVLYSDGHIEQLEKNELLKELEILTASNPDILKVLPPYNSRKYNK